MQIIPPAQLEELKTDIVAQLRIELVSDLKALLQPAPRPAAPVAAKRSPARRKVQKSA